MTLILGTLYGGAMFQASDRRLTLRDQAVEWDANANKSIVITLPGAVLFIGYSGISYVGSIPTDTWLAASCAGTEAVGSSALRDRVPDLRGVDAGRVARRVQESVRSHVLSLRSRERRRWWLSVQIIGIRYTRRLRPIAVLFEITTSEADPADVRINFHRVYDWCARGAGGRLPVPHFVVTPPLRPFLTSAFRKVITHPMATNSIEAMDNSLVGCVAAASAYRVMEGARVSEIGEDVLSLVCDPLRAPVIEVAYTPYGQGYASSPSLIGASAPVIPTPWYLGRAGYMPPQLVTGDMEAGLGGDPWYLKIKPARVAGPIPLVMAASQMDRTAAPGTSQAR